MMTDRERAMLAHPAGKGIPASPEVAQARMDAEACAVGSLNWRVNEWHHGVSSRPAPRWLEVARSIVFGLVVFAVIWGVCVAGELAGGWPL